MTNFEMSNIIRIYVLAVIIDGVDTSEMTRDKLEQFTMRVKEELDKEREERNLFQLERDKIRIFWEITRTELEELRADIRLFINLGKQ